MLRNMRRYPVVRIGVVESIVLEECIMNDKYGLERVIEGMFKRYAPRYPIWLSSADFADDDHHHRHVQVCFIRDVGSKTLLASLIFFGKAILIRLSSLAFRTPNKHGGRCDWFFPFPKPRSPPGHVEKASVFLNHSLHNHNFHEGFLVAIIMGLEHTSACSCFKLIITFRNSHIWIGTHLGKRYWKIDSFVEKRWPFSS